MANEILKHLEAAGLKIGIAPITRLAELEQDYQALVNEQVFTEDVAGMLAHIFRFSPPEGLDACSMLCVAVPSPVARAVFCIGEKKLTAEVPPTYIDYGVMTEKIENMLNGALQDHGFKAKWAGGLPHKLLAARCGLARYGRNNIAYVDAMGSFVYLAAFFSDMPCEGDSWGEAARMPQCGKCTACVKACPTGAIREDRRLIDAGRCLTMHNERDSSVPFPDWIDPKTHNSLVGCMACQLACPMNRKVLQHRIETMEFNEEEAELMLQGTSVDKFSARMSEKFDRLNMKAYYEAVPRNLKALMKKEELL